MLAWNLTYTFKHIEDIAALCKESEQAHNFQDVSPALLK